MIDWDLRIRPTLAAVHERLPESWRGYFRISAEGTRSVSTNATTSAEWGGLLPGTLYDRPDTDRAAAAARTPEQASALLDAHGVTRAVLNPGVAPRISGLGSARWAGALSSAINDWVLERWLPADERFLMSLLVSARSPRRAADEIARLGGHDRVAQVVLAYPPLRLGERALEPILAAAAQAGLPVQLQAGGAYTGANAGFTAVGHPGSGFEADADWIHAAQPHLSSVVSAGVLERHPDLRLVVNGFGLAWLPSLLWRLDADHRAGRALPPAKVRRVPSELLAERVRFTTAGAELPADPQRLFALLDLVGGRDLVLFGSGAEGLEAEATQALLAAVPEDWRGAVLDANASALAAAAVA